MRRIGTSLKGQQGLTLIELMFSFGIMTLVILSSFFVMVQAHQMSEDSRTRLLALNAARTTLEQIKDTPLANVPAINTAAFVPADLPGANIVITTNPANVAAAVVATVTVTVNYFGPRRRPGTVQVSTMRSRFQ